MSEQAVLEDKLRLFRWEMRKFFEAQYPVLSVGTIPVRWIEFEGEDGEIHRRLEHDPDWTANMFWVRLSFDSPVSWARPEVSQIISVELLDDVGPKELAEILTPRLSLRLDQILEEGPPSPPAGEG